MKECRGITLVALVITIIIIIILTSVTINFTFGEKGLITQAIIAKNETEVSIVKEALQLYYLNEEAHGTSNNPVGNKIEIGMIKDEVEQGLVVKHQNVDIADNIIYDRLYYLDQKALGINVTKNRYYMDIETRKVYIHDGIQVRSGIIYELNMSGTNTSQQNNILPEGSKIVALGNVSYIIDKNGQVYGLGEIGAYNYLGLNYIDEYDTTNKPQRTDIKVLPIDQATDNDFIDVASDGSNTFLLKKNGDVYAVGNNGFGILGVGDTIARYDLTKVKIDNVEKIYLRASAVYFLKKDKTLWACGKNIVNENQNLKYNVINNSNEEYYTEPVRITYQENGKEVFENIKLVSQETNNNSGIIIIKENGEIWSGVGRQFPGKFGEGSEQKVIETPKRLTTIEELLKSKNTSIKMLYTSTTTTALLLENKEVYTSGHANDNGLGGSKYTFTKAIDGIEELYMTKNSNYAAFYAKKENGEVYTWGEHTGLENGFTSLPTLFNIEDKKIQKVTSKLALTENGEVYRIGLPINNQMIEKYTNIEARQIFERAVVDKDNNLWIFGPYLIKDKGRKILLTKSELKDVENILVLRPNVNNITIQKKDGSYASWGNNSYYKITDSNETLYVNPQDLRTTNAIPSEITTIKKYVVGEFNSYIIDQNQNLWYKGYSAANAVPQNTQFFTKATNISNVKDVFYMGYSTIVQKNDGTLWGIGRNDRGDLGLGDIISVSTYTQIKQDKDGNDIDFSNIEKVATGYRNISVLMKDGTIYTWGDNSNRHLGLDTETLYINRPTKMNYFEQIGERVIDIYHMNANVIYLTEQGNVYISGSNNSGQIGNGTRNSSLLPQKTKIDNVKQIIPGASHVIAIKNDNSVWAWGAGGFGQLGTERTQDELVPVPVYGLLKID